MLAFFMAHGRNTVQFPLEKREDLRHNLLTLENLHITLTPQKLN